MAATNGTSPVLVASGRRTLFSGPYASDIYHQNCDVASDGRGFLFVRPAAEYRRFIYVDNWVAELQSRRATSR